MSENLNLADVNLKNIFNNGIDELNNKFNLIRKFDLQIQKIADKIDANQNGTDRRIKLKIENGQWHFYKIIAFEHPKPENKTLQSLKKLIRHIRIDNKYVDNAVKNMRYENVRELIISSKQLILMRNNIVAKIGNAMGGIKRLKSELDAETNSRIIMFLKRLPD